MLSLDYAAQTTIKFCSKIISLIQASKHKRAWLTRVRRLYRNAKLLQNCGWKTENHTKTRVELAHAAFDVMYMYMYMYMYGMFMYMYVHRCNPVGASVDIFVEVWTCRRRQILKATRKTFWPRKWTCVWKHTQHEQRPPIALWTASNEQRFRTFHKPWTETPKLCPSSMTSLSSPIMWFDTRC